ncbi:c-type cytochrome [Halomonas huangheensis]|uniref:Cytochrome c domain-containing protein n=1 Tax=Halomonas huangheensis TaxID=1178482 RepID=W1N6W6_9GAMM|nr:c-type cytochrome [Halomonas huangheensis]ALM54340.1 cytochrome C [Halomonas huangheensis]ERL50901.1 hypothetical protein BJB45_20095 [Halomonas huangheensis]
MKFSKLIIGCLVGMGLASGQAMAQDDADHDAIAERLKPVGEVCLQGEDCGTAQAAASDSAASSGGAVDGEAIYGSVCMACHDTGAAGAPKRGEEADWTERSAQGFSTLLDHAINGLNAMPPRGGNPNLSDEEVRAALVHLVESVMEVPAAEEAAPAEESSAEAADAAESETADAAATDADASTSEESAGDEAAADADSAAEGTTASDEATASEASGDEAAAEDDGAEAATAGIDGQAVYESVCFACHDTGAANAPKRGDAATWEPRIAEGMETLYDHAINGLNAMPPKGGNPKLSDEEVKAAVDYMVQ